MIRTVLFAAILLPATALAQVSVNPGALDQLKPSAPAHSAPSSSSSSSGSGTRTARQTHDTTHAPARRATTSSHTTTRSSRAAPPPEPKPKPKPRPVTVPAAPPPAAVLPPPVELPKAAITPPPPVPIVPDAAGVAAPVSGGVQITFGVGSSDLNPATFKAVQDLANEVKAEPDVDLNVLAYAAGVPDDPSTSRRLSLSRALAARAVLISQGIVSTRIYVRALGATPSDGPADRVDVVRVGTPSPPTTATPTPATPNPATPTPATTTTASPPPSSRTPPPPAKP